jgi:uncharacterized membrane protein YeaQ/YmgE (transglycosylase-associated protein family)
MGSLNGFIYILLVGALAGWISGLVTKGKGFGVPGNIIVGVIGAFLADFLFGLLGIRASGLVGQLIFAVAGALLFVYLLKFIKK